MNVPGRRTGVRHAVGVLVGLGALAFAGCIDRPAKPVTPVPQSGVSINDPNTGVNTVDLLMMVDNSNSMRDNQSNIMSQFGTMIDALTNPPCASVANPTAHTCNPADPTDLPIYAAVHDLHVGVVSSDLGTPGSTVPGCVNTAVGDDGLLNPIRNGGAVGMHEPWMTAPPTFGRPADCTDPNEYPSFISFTSGMTDPTTFAHDFQCNAGLYVNGCGLESQLEAVYRALITHGDAPTGDGANAGFLRANALLAILLLTDEEDGSVRNCAYANGDPCTDATDVYNAASTNWSDPNLNMRFYMYPHPGDATDPTWPVDRYVDPTNLDRGFLSLKPGRPDLIVFAAITGIPLDPPMIGSGATASVDWDQLLGPPGPGGRDDFAGRQSALAYTADSPEGPVSMRPANMDTTCAPDTRTVPACRRRGTTPVAGDCTTAGQYFAWPSRREVEIARRFDQDPLCNNAPCHSGLVTSICDNDYSAAMSQVVAQIRGKIHGNCLPRQLQLNPESYNGQPARGVTCVIEESLSPGAPQMCDPALGRQDPVNQLTGQRVAQQDPVTHTRVCEINQVYLDPATNQPIDPTVPGWFYDTSTDPSDPTCTQRISYQAGATPETGSVTHLECLQTFVTSDGGSGG